MNDRVTNLKILNCLRVGFISTLYVLVTEILLVIRGIVTKNYKAKMMDIGHLK